MAEDQKIANLAVELRFPSVLTGTGVTGRVDSLTKLQLVVWVWTTYSPSSTVTASVTLREHVILYTYY